MAGSIKRCHSIDPIVDQKSQIDADCACLEKVIRTTMWEMQTDLSVRLESNDLRIHPACPYRTFGDLDRVRSIDTSNSEKLAPVSPGGG